MPASLSQPKRAAGAGLYVWEQEVQIGVAIFQTLFPSAIAESVLVCGQGLDKSHGPGFEVERM